MPSDGTNFSPGSRTIMLMLLMQSSDAQVANAITRMKTMPVYPIHSPAFREISEILLYKAVNASKPKSQEEWEAVSSQLNQELSPRVQITKRNCRQHFEAALRKFRGGDRRNIAK